MQKLRRITGMLFLGAALVVSTAAAQPPEFGISMMPDLFTFEEDSKVTVNVMLENTTGLAGVDLTLAYPSDRFDGPPTFEAGDFAGSLAVNTTGTPGQVVVAFARSTGLSVSGGRLMSLTFSVPCQGNQGFENGRALDLTYESLVAWDEESQSLDIDSPASTIRLKCTAVSVAPAASFSALKARFDRTIR